jgi:hypothetical protein
MGLRGGEENGKGEGVVEIHMGSKNKYKRMDSDGTEEEEALSNEGIAKKNHNTRRFVFICAIFASLNSVLLGYG